ncbi:2-dehydropantoate 2-reductase [Paenibacillus sp. LHD-117]|uniref:ketopantoate reductase family protein n=1 Tax=Paenibacillus sp. LHD-117 TaxID=3071412 RepID=UPI0027E08A19|nr:2-dehydropantoate 2-reductase [Paenibacillus sp. LHD-117]MDQ6418981.1 2-dehydropantoate 2-reductase [Paenibacillus sp. LHD-117]
MRIGIIGGGSIGLLIGAKLAESGTDVTVWTRTENQSENITKKGIRLLAEHGSEKVVKAAGEWLSEERLRTAEKAGVRSCEWYILALKQTDLSEEVVGRIIRLIRLTPGAPALVCMQNGTGHLEKLAEAAAGGFDLYNAVTTVGAKREDERSVRHTGHGLIHIGSRAENSIDAGSDASPERVPDMADQTSNRQKMLLESLIRAGFDASLSNDIHNRVFQKLLMNAIINPLTAIFDIRNGELPSHPRGYPLMKALHLETEAILRAAGMDEWQDSWEGVLGVCQRTSQNVSSMLADVRAGRRTEIGSINGEIVRLATAHGLQAPLNESVLRLVEAFGSGQ